MGEYNDKIGDHIILHMDGHGVKFEVVITEIDERGRGCRFKVVHKDPLWGALGLLQEGEEWVFVEWEREMKKLGPQDRCRN